MAGEYQRARARIYAAHDEDPNKIAGSDGTEIAYETHYSQKMEKYLQARQPDASDILKLAIAGQHFRRWEVPRSQFPMTKVGYHSWRTHLKKRQAQLVGAILEECRYTQAEVKRCIALIEKEGLKQGEQEVQVLEDVACLVFLDDQFDEFKEKHDEEKIITILKKTWVKMSDKGHTLALEIPMTEDCKSLVGKALQAT